MGSMDSEPIPLRRRVGPTLFRRPSTLGIAFAELLWWQSLTPTLMPRSAAAQGAIGGISIAVGFGIGTLLWWAARPPLQRSGRMPSTKTRQRVRQALYLTAMLLTVAGIPLWMSWQNEQRDLFGLEHLALGPSVLIVPVTVLVGFIFGIIGRGAGALIRALQRWSKRRLPARIATPATVVIVFLLGGIILPDLAFSRFTTWAATTFGAADQSTNPGTVQPTTSTVSAGPGSLISWDSLGVQGRDFVAGATTADKIRAFYGPDANATEPVRVYAGLRSAPDARSRAKLVVEELERTGGFDRSVLVVATSTGTGWIDPDAAGALEMLHHGDTAIASIQYSFLPSWISFLTDLDLASEAGAELFNAVSEARERRPAERRPKLIVFGLSLGSFGAEGAFVGLDANSSVANIVGRSDGALFVGAPDANPIRRQITTERDAGSPYWSPTFRDGSTVRVTTRDPNQPPPPGPWKQPRVNYVNHPSDPVVYWGMSWLWSKPGWMDAPRGYDVTDRGRWFPFVTWLQGVFDLMAGFSAPPGFGHDYQLDYVRAWADVVPPDGWTATDTTRLEQHLFPAS